MTRYLAFAAFDDNDGYVDSFIIEAKDRQEAGRLLKLTYQGLTDVELLTTADLQNLTDILESDEPADIPIDTVSSQDDIAN